MSRLIPTEPAEEADPASIRVDIPVSGCNQDLKVSLTSALGRHSAKFGRVVVVGPMNDQIEAYIRAALHEGDGISESPPVDLINIVGDGLAFGQLAQPVSGIAVRTVLAESIEPAQALAALGKLEVDGIDEALFVWMMPGTYSCAEIDRRRSDPDHMTRCLMQWKTINLRHGIIVLDSCSHDPGPVIGIDDEGEAPGFAAVSSNACQETGADRFLMLAARTGLFPKPDYAKLHYDGDEEVCSSLYWLEDRPYSVRKAMPGDLVALVNLENECWTECRRSSIEIIKWRIETYPDGQWVLEYGGEIAGVIYSQRIQAVEVLTGAAADSVAMHHTPTGPVVQLLAVNVLPRFQHLGLGDQLLEFVLQCCAATRGVDRVVAVSLCRDYASHACMPMDEYIHVREERGFLVDPILRFHDNHGATIAGLMPGYRPADIDNHGNGVLVTYDIRNRKSRDTASGLHAGNTHLEPSRQEPAAVARIVEDGIRQLLGPVRMAAYSPDRSLMEMGMDSLDLMRLRGYLTEKLGYEPEASFFFRYSTASAMTKALHRAPVGDDSAKQSEVPVEMPLNQHNAFRETDHGVGKISALPPTASGDIAIIGFGCRFPAANSVSEYWSLLYRGGNGIGLVPQARGNRNSRFTSGESTDGTKIPARGGFIENVDCFDAAFFGISPREANLLDPQQRLLLEVTHEALEHAGLAPDSLRGSDTGVFIGLFSHDYELLQVKQNRDGEFEPYFATGNSMAVAAGRLAYAFGWHGPALAVDTACSSSLVAVHLACQSLKTGESSIAIAGGVNLLLSPELTAAFSRAGMLSPDGCCRTFDEGANGYVRSEGCGVVVLKALRQAVLDNDEVFAVVKGTAINQDGASNGLTAPNQLAQESVIRRALSDAGLKAQQISYVEAHGTGTPLGDPVEMHALRAVYGKNRSKLEPLIVGSVKTNIGHTEAAAGIAGLLKVVLSLQHGYIPPHLHFRSPNPHMDLDRIPAVVPAQGRDWPATVKGSGARNAGVSSFGFSGTNAHVIVQDAPAQHTVPGRDVRRYHVLALSAKTDSALRMLATQLAAHLNVNPGLRLADVCYTQATGRSAFSHRLGVVASTVAEACDRLTLAADGHSAGGCASSASLNPDAQIAFLFTGQGSQSVGMGRELYDTHPGFREMLDHCVASLQPSYEIPLLDVLFGGKDEGSILHETAYAQPLLFSLEYALAQLWMSWGVIPSALMGHSVGEYVAACIAGVMSMEDCCLLLAARARLMQSLPENGAMAAVFEDRCQVEEAIAPYAHRVSIAADNGPANIVISGDRDCVHEICAHLEKDGVSHRKLHVSRGFHSSLMEPMMEEFSRVAQGIAYFPPRIDIISNITGRSIGCEIALPAYWVRHVRQEVLFKAGIDTLLEQGVRTFLEIGPKPVLTGMGCRCTGDAKIQWLASLNTGMPDWEQLARSIAALFASGHAVNWPAFYRDTGFKKVVLPGYPFERKRFWLDTPVVSDDSGSRKSVNRSHHPLLGSRVRSALKEIQFESCLNANNPAYLGDHRLFQRAVLPAAAYVEMGFAAVRSINPAKNWTMTGVRFSHAMEMPDTGEKSLQCILTPFERAPYPRYGFEIFSAMLDATDTETRWQMHGGGSLQVAEKCAQDSRNLSALKATCSRQKESKAFYAGLERRDYGYGPLCRAIQEIWCGENEVLARLELPEELTTAAGDYCFHPVLLDASFQAVLAVTDRGILVPVGLDSVRLWCAASQAMWVHIKIRDRLDEMPGELMAEVVFMDTEGCVIAQLDGLRMRAVTLAELFVERPDRIAESSYCVEWRAQALALENGSVAAVAALSRLKNQLETFLNTGKSASPSADCAEMLKELESVSGLFVVAALSEMGQDMSIGQRFSEEELRGHLGVVSQHWQQFGRLLDILRENGWLSCEAGSWVVIQNGAAEGLTQKLARIRERHAAIREEIELLGRCGENLAAVLQGRCDPLQLLFPDGDLKNAARFYDESPTFVGMNQAVAEVVSRLVSEMPAGRPVRILEVGAGTGGLTVHILPRLPRDRTRYLFTDVSRLFLNKAQDRFHQLPFVEYRLLDIERSPQSQGFSAHEFDIVLAANVLHATRDLAQTLGNVKQLLAPNGFLVLLEGTGRRSWIDLIFGLTEGWWRFEDQPLRSHHPLLDNGQWLQLIGRQGFEDGIAVCPDNDGDPMLFRQSIIVSRVPSSAVRKVCGHGRWLLFGDSKQVADRLAERFSLQGDDVILVRRGDSYARIDDRTMQIRADRPEDYDRLLSECGADLHTLRGVVHLWALDLDNVESAMSGSGIAGLADSGYGSVLDLVKSLVSTGYKETPRLWLVTRGAQSTGADDLCQGIAQSLLWGMGSVIALEHPDLRCSRFDLSADTGDAEIGALHDEINRAMDEDQIALRNGTRYVARLARYRHSSDALAAYSGTLRLEIRERGTLDELVLREVPRKPPIGSEVEICVHSAGLNFRDVLNALGRYPGDPGLLGDECAGEVVAIGPDVDNLAPGDFVLAMAAGSFSEYVTVDSTLAIRLPGAIDTNEAATIPIAFLTASYGLRHLAGIKAGDRVLIHAASGGVGQAAIQIAQQAGAEVFATASPAKWDVLRGLGVKHIMNSRELDFANEILKETGGHGVDIVLNCLAGQFIPATLSVVTDGGFFLELGKAGVWSREQVAKARPGISYSAIDLLALRRHQPQLIQSMLSDLMTEFSRGVLSPLPCTLCKISDATQAFRYMQQARHTGKIVLTMAERPTVQKAIAGVKVRADASYLITGGTGDLGLLVARWLIEQGAQRLILVSRNGGDDKARHLIESLHQTGAHVLVQKVDVCNIDALGAVIDSCTSGAFPLRGIVHAAGVLEDGALYHQTRDKFHRVLAPKVEGAWNLHRLTQNLALDFFTLFSSSASLLGTPGQANHAAANSFLDQLAHYRRHRGLAANSINWGAWSEIGAAARNNVAEHWEVRGIASIDPASGLRAFGQLLACSPIQVGVVPVDWPCYMQQFSMGPQRAFYKDFVQASIVLPDLPVAFHKAVPNTEAVCDQIRAGDTAGLIDYLRFQLSRVLRLDPSIDLSSDRRLNELGLDSLTGIEIRNRIDKDLGVRLSLDQFFNQASVMRWSSLIREQLALNRIAQPGMMMGNRLEAGHEEMTL